MRIIMAMTLLTMVWTAQVDAKEIIYADILADPSKYVGKTVTMSGVFAYTEPMRESFTLDQNSNLIEVFYGDLPQQDKDVIASQKRDAKTPVVVTGIVQRYTNDANKYFINASSISVKD